MNKLIKMATFVAGVGAMLSFAGCGNESSSGAGDNKATSKPAVKMTPIQEFTANAREVGALLTQVVGAEVGDRIGKGMAEEAEKLAGNEKKFKEIYDQFMPTFKNAKVYLPLALKAKKLADDLEKTYKVPTGRIRQLGFDQRKIPEFLEPDSAKQLNAIEHMKATIVELEKYKKQLGSLMK